MWTGSAAVSAASRVAALLAAAAGVARRSGASIPLTMNYQFCHRSHTGLLRANNEDSVILDGLNGLAVLADGMGGYNAGEVASGMATSQVAQELGRWLAENGQHATARELRRAMEISVYNANRAIFNAARGSSDYSGMGTTLVLGVFLESRVFLGHIGDSRAYRLRGAELTQLTRDHSLLQEQMDAGLITPAQAAMSNNRNLVTRAMGVEDAVALDIGEHRVEPGDIFLLCSDGLSDMISSQDIARILAALHPLEQKADQLIEQANAHGGRDNISVLLAEVAGASKKRGLMSRLLGK